MLQLSAALVIFAITIATSLIGLFGSPRLVDRCLFRPYWFLRRREFDTAILSGLVHADPFHLLFNMLTFYFFAFPLERVIGTPKFLVLYIAGLLFSHLGTWYRYRNNRDYMCLGASGAISAVLFTAILYWPNAQLSLFFLPIYIPAWLFGILYLVYTWYSARNPSGRIAHDAHLGGALTGLAFVLLTEPRLYPRFLDVVF